MKKIVFPKGIPIDEKRISFLEKVVARLTRRAKTTRSTIITPYPISACIMRNDISGEVLRYMFSSPGKITTCSTYFNKKPKNGINLSIELVNEPGGKANSFLLSNKEHEFTVDLIATKNNRLTISLNPLSDEEGVDEVWISLLWVPDVKETVIKHQLIKDLENDISEE